MYEYCVFLCARSANMNSNHRIIINTAILYFKLLFEIVVNLYSTRLILNAMGVSDYGIVNLISGIVALLSFFQNSLTISTQRFLSVNMGKNDIISQLKIFNTGVFIHLLLGVVIVIVLELITPLVFGSYIQIPEARMTSSQILYQLTIVGTFLVVIAVPYDASLNAHENMFMYSIACISESLIRLVGALIILNYKADKLIFYGFLIIAIRFFSLIIKWAYCSRKYEDVKLKLSLVDFRQLRQMLSFAGWNVIGGFSVSLRSQGIAVILNMFLGVVVNAAYGIANQVAGQLNNFAANITKAMAPQIMQSKGAGDDEHMISLSIKQCKYSFILYSIFAVPLFIEMPSILKIWLTQIPDNAIVFCRLMLVVSMVQQITVGLQTLIQANGRIALYQTMMALFILLNMPAAYLVLWLGMEPYYVIIAMVVVELICMSVRIILAHRLVSLPYKMVLNQLLKPIVIMTVISVLIIYVLMHIVICESELLRVFFNGIISVISVLIGGYIMLSKSEKKYILNIINNFKMRFIC